MAGWRPALVTRSFPTELNLYHTSPRVSSLAFCDGGFRFLVLILILILISIVKEEEIKIKIRIKIMKKMKTRRIAP